jgi:integrase
MKDTTLDRPWRRPGALAYARTRVAAALRPPVSVYPIPAGITKAQDVPVRMRDGVSELADLAVRGVRLQKPAMVSLTGKGRKTRHVPLDGGTVTLLASYLQEQRLDQPGSNDHPVFFNQHRARLSRGGIAWIIRKYQPRPTAPCSPASRSARTSCGTARPCTSKWE